MKKAVPHVMIVTCHGFNNLRPSEVPGIISLGNLHGYTFL